jgi:integrase
LSRLERDIFPFLGGRPITAIETPELLGVLRRIEARGVREAVRRARQDCEQIFTFAIATGKCRRNPATGLSRALAPKKKTVHFPAITDPQKFGELLRTMDGYQGSFTVCCALRLAPLFAVRPGEMRKAKWPDFDLHNAPGSYCSTFMASSCDSPGTVPTHRSRSVCISQCAQHQTANVG